MNTKPTPVTIVRPKPTETESLIQFIGNLIALALAGWVIYGISSELGHPLSYWHSILVVTAARVLRGNPSAYTVWSKAGK